MKYQYSTFTSRTFSQSGQQTFCIALYYIDCFRKMLHFN
uniref:Uncharacterized protein n=1 Tax=Anguilla anguilla TaxID=7936 RepID=A0A0E9PJ75_ANGAN